MHISYHSKRWLIAGLVLCAAAAPRANDLTLFDAVKHRDLESVRTLIRQHADVNAPQGDGSTALHWAARVDDVAIADVLIRAGARPNTANDVGATPLHLACINGSAAMVDRLLKAGARADGAFVNGETVLMTCARSGNAATVKSLLVHGAKVNAKETSHDQTALMWAAAQGHAKAVQTLIEAGADIHARSRAYPEIVVGEDTQRAGREELNYMVVSGGMTPLLFAARSGDAESTRLILAAGADANERRADGSSALLMAAYSARTQAGLALVEQGADPNDMTTGFTPLHAAILRSDVTLVKALLEHGAKPDLRLTKGTPKRRDGEDFNFQAPVIGSTAYLLAARYLEPEVLRALKDAGADTTLTMPNGATALMLAAGMGSPSASNRRGVRAVDFGKVEPESLALETVSELLKQGADVNGANQAGDTAVHAAALLDYNTVIQFLVDHGAQVNVANKRGLTPLAALTSSGRGRGRGAAAADANNDDAVEPSHAATIALLRKLAGER